VNVPAPKVTPGLIPNDWLLPLNSKLPDKGEQGVEVGVGVCVVVLVGVGVGVDEVLVGVGVTVGV
jgi:hypothetical protein